LKIEEVKQAINQLRMKYEEMKPFEVTGFPNPCQNYININIIEKNRGLKLGLSNLGTSALLHYDSKQLP
jgi:hypothetical protein